jgi:hypothetical protein
LLIQTGQVKPSRAVATTKGCDESQVPLNIFSHRCIHADPKPSESNAVKVSS